MLTFGGTSRLLALLVCVFGIGLVSTASAAPGDISLKAGPGGCVTGSGSSGACTASPGFGDGIVKTKVSPDGSRLYAAGFVSTLVTLDRDAATGSLSIDPRPKGCLSSLSDPGCGGNGAGLLTQPNGIGVSSDGQNVYVTARGTSSLSVFDYRAFPDPANLGPLLRKSGADGCQAEGGFSACANAQGLVNASDVVVSADGQTVYAAGRHPTGGGVTVFDRSSTGVLTQKVDEAGCTNNTGDGVCADGRALPAPLALAVSPEGDNLYVASLDDSGAFAVFDINPDGTISQKAGAAGCFNIAGSDGCTAATGLMTPTDVAVSPDGKSVYVTSEDSTVDGETDTGSLVVFDRAANGNLTQRAGQEGCYTSDGAGPCGTSALLIRSYGVIASDESVYVSAFGRPAATVGANLRPAALLDFGRDPDTGELTQKSESAGCFVSSTFGSCQVKSILGNARNPELSPGGDSLYVGGAGLTIFDRDDGVAPATTILEGPSGETSETTVSFGFEADEADATFECRMDSEPFASCVSPKAFSGLSVGAHTFQVKATDKSGNAEASPASRAFTVVKGPIGPTGKAVLKVSGFAPRKPSVKKNKTMNIKVTSTNSGDAAVAGAKICLGVSKAVRKSIKPQGKACQSIGGLTAGAKSVKTFKLKATKKLKKGKSYRLSFTLSASGTGTAKASVSIRGK